MPRQIALFICIIFILWLFVRDRKLRPMTSGALWVVFLWLVITGSRPVSLWFGSGIQIDKIEDYLDGSPVDRNVFILLILTGLVLLLRRNIHWRGIFNSNKWVFVFFFYCGISLIWSDFPFISLKRWIKDLGNVVMVLIIVTEEEPVQAIRAIMARYTYIIPPLSILFIKYFPEIGRSYNRWTWEPMFLGVTTNKNELGCAIFICGLFLVWELLYMQTPDSRVENRADIVGRFILFLIVIWVIVEARSSSAQICLILGTGILFILRLPRTKIQAKYLGTYTFLLIFLIIILYTSTNILDTSLELLGRDRSLTGRTDLWRDLLVMPINRLWGTGYQSFWLGSGAALMWAKYSFHPTQAHNGYLETYLNLGLVGVFFLIGTIVSTGVKLKREILFGSSYGVLCFTFLVVAISYNWTEAFFNKLSPIWIILLIAALSSPSRAKSMP